MFGSDSIKISYNFKGKVFIFTTVIYQCLALRRIPRVRMSLSDHS